MYLPKKWLYKSVSIFIFHSHRLSYIKTISSIFSDDRERKWCYKYGDKFDNPHWGSINLSKERGKSGSTGLILQPYQKVRTWLGTFNTKEEAKFHIVKWQGRILALKLNFMSWNQMKITLNVTTNSYYYWKADGEKFWAKKLFCSNFEFPYPVQIWKKSESVRYRVTW